MRTASTGRARAGVAAAFVAVVASLLPAAAFASVRQASVVLVLRPMDATKLQALAVEHSLPRTVRAAALKAVTPTAKRRSAVADVARSAGLSVTTTTAWTLRVRGDADTVSAMFGTLPASTPQRLGTAYPNVPASLRPYVVAALPTAGRVARPLAAGNSVNGKDLRTAYSAPGDTNLGAGFTIATIQLAGWAGLPDLQQFAQNQSPPLPQPTSSTYVERSIDGGDPRGNDHQDGDSEVALDQEALLATAPSATQIAYFAPNDDGGQGYLDAVRQVGADALSGSANIAALSLSWGGCEASYDRSWIAAMDQALQYTLAAGVTIFAASGDQGSADCVGQIPGPQQTRPAVDYPAASPYAVAVGGTSLPNPQQPSTAQGWSGSGGGESSVEAMPAWQARERGLAPHGRRLVPDISSDADAASGLEIYNSRYVDPATGQPTPQSIVGGTSLAAPTQAALLVDTLSSAGWSRGVGDIHQALYSAGASGFTDITTDKPADDGMTGNGAYRSGPGFDLVTGLGTPVWNGLAPALGAFQLRTARTTRSLTVGLSELLPSSTAPAYRGWSTPVVNGTPSCAAATGSAPRGITLPTGSPDGSYTISVAGIDGSGANNGGGSCHVASSTVLLDRRAPVVGVIIQVSGSGQAVARWAARDASPSSGLQKFRVALTVGSTTVWSATGTGTQHYFNALPHSRWHLRVTAFDAAGNAATTTAHLYDDSSFVTGARWSRSSSSSAFRHGFSRADRPGAASTLTVTGRVFTVYVTKCASCGQLGIYDQHGHRIAVVDTYSSRARYRVAVTILSTTTPAKRTFVFRVLSSKNRTSKGRSVGIDAFAFT